MNAKKHLLAALTSILVIGCMPKPQPITRVPALEYSKRLKQELAAKDPHYRREYLANGFSSGAPSAAVPIVATAEAGPNASLRLVSENDTGELPIQAAAIQRQEGAEMVTNLGEGEGGGAGGYSTYPSTAPLSRDYVGPLALGDPGLSASLWRESRSANDLFRDYRAFQPMDLITIVVTESAEGKKEADTEVKQKTTVEAAIENLLGIEDTINRTNPQVNLDSLISATTTNDYKGEGETNRKGSLKAKISAMVVEVLPSGILRIEGEKIVSVNSEDEVMVISGLVRPEDVNSSNEVDSSKVGNMRIDYYGTGTVGDAQKGGWLDRIIRNVWPF
ncbi:MAG: hypothetical protein DCC75_03675 [Proteobacteria bacterium]|nr:MAG: hypothetical protein DCC75_03675 [Pseudomonadota bacterium]